VPGTFEGERQYSLLKILAIWASVTAPMGLLAFVVAPAVIPHTSLHPGLVHWIFMLAGMAWQFVVSLAVLRHELGGLRWQEVKERIRLNRPLDPTPAARDGCCGGGPCPRSPPTASVCSLPPG